MSTEILTMIYLAIAIIPGVLSCIAFPLVILSLDRRFQKDINHYPQMIKQENVFFRTISLAFNVVFKNRTEWDRIMKYHYQGFDFRSYATPFEKVVCFIYTVGIFLFIFLGLLAYPVEFLGLINLGLLS